MKMAYLCDYGDAKRPIRSMSKTPNMKLCFADMVELVNMRIYPKTIASYLILRRRVETRKFENAAVVKSCLCVCGVQKSKWLLIDLAVCPSSVCNQKFKK